MPENEKNVPVNEMMNDPADAEKIREAVKRFYGIDPETASPEVREYLCRRARARMKQKEEEKRKLLAAARIFSGKAAEAGPGTPGGAPQTGEQHREETQDAPEITDEEYEALKLAFSDIEAGAGEECDPEDENEEDEDDDEEDDDDDDDEAERSTACVIFFVFGAVIWIAGFIYASMNSTSAAGFFALVMPYFVYGIIVFGIATIIDMLS